MEIGKFAVLILPLLAPFEKFCSTNFAHQELNKDKETTVCDDARQILRSTPNALNHFILDIFENSRQFENFSIGLTRVGIFSACLKKREAQQIIKKIN